VKLRHRRLLARRLRLGAIRHGDREGQRLRSGDHNDLQDDGNFYEVNSTTARRRRRGSRAGQVREGQNSTINADLLKLSYTPG
jgi:hypothetical protein